MEASPKGTVPVLVADRVIEESLEVMDWALALGDPEGLLYAGSAARDLVVRCEAEFKGHLDRFKYAVRYEGVDREEERRLAAVYLWELDGLLAEAGLFVRGSDRVCGYWHCTLCAAVCQCGSGLV